MCWQCSVLSIVEKLIVLDNFSTMSVRHEMQKIENH